jgi:hypothetical protein
MHDLVRSLMALLATKTLLPPFAATAMLIGDRQIMTFDGRFYDFVGSCSSFLLTGDFGHHRFAVVATYRRERRESLRILIHGGNTIDLQRDGRVFLNNNRLELPVILGDTYIHREGGGRIQLHSRQGLLVDCNTVHNICTIKLSGWYFGRTGGLLGVYDNEPSNDWMSADRLLVEDLDSFVQSWRVGAASCGDMSAVTAAAVYTPMPLELNLTTWDREKCADLFLSPESSLLLPCFATVDPRPYHSLCLQQLAGGQASGGGPASFCQVAAAYAEDCRWNGVEISVPGECVTCLAPLHAPLRGGETISYQGNAPRSMDVILVVELDHCLDQMRFRQSHYRIPCCKI